MNIYDLTLDVASGQVQGVLGAKYGDTARAIRFHFRENSMPWVIDGSFQAVFTAVKADGKILYNHCRYENGDFIYYFTPQTASCPGLMRCELRIFAGERMLTSPRFDVLVVDTLYHDGDVLDSTSEASALQGYLEEASSLVEEIHAALARGDFQGEPGPQGEKGDPGADGKSAYALAQEAGYAGSEAELAKKLADPSCFLTTYTVGGDGSTVIADHTYAQQKAAYDGGKVLIANGDGQIFSLMAMGDGFLGYGFIFVDAGGAQMVGILHQEDETIELFLDGFPSVAVDSELSNTSENPVQNKAIYDALNSFYEGAMSMFSPKDMVIHVESVDGKYVADKTYAEIDECYNAGGTLYVEKDELLFPLYSAYGNTYAFLLLVPIESALATMVVVIHSTNDIEVTEDSTRIPTKTSQLTNNSGFITAAAIPATLPSPGKLTFTGAATGEYDGSGDVTVEIPAGGQQVETVTVLSDNLFDKASAVAGKQFYHSGSGPTLLDNTGAFYSYVELRGAGTYRFRLGISLHGDEYGVRTPLLKEDMTFVRNATATILDASNRDSCLMEVVVTESDIASGVTLMAFDGLLTYLDTLMVVKDIPYPDQYIPYGYIQVPVESGTTQNPLWGKTALFFGDSICAGTTVDASSETYGYGWAGLIGEANGMVWENYGWNGAVITGYAGAERVMDTKVTDAISKYATADYIILEGGCNDADNLASQADGLGTVAEGYSGFDTTCFSGALEALILKLVNAYPNGKIGYIVAQKMNTSLAGQQRYRAYFDRAVEICQKWGIPVLDLWNTNPMNPMLPVYYTSGSEDSFYTDGQHLSQKGYDHVASQIQNWMKTL